MNNSETNQGCFSVLFKFYFTCKSRFKWSVYAKQIIFVFVFVHKDTLRVGKIEAFQHT